MLVLTIVWVTAYLGKVGFENFMRASIESSPRASQKSKQEIDKEVEQQSHPVIKYFVIGASAIAVIIFYFILN